MTKQQLRALRGLEGRYVSIALDDGTRVDDCRLVSGGRDRVTSVWLFTNGQDLFVPRRDIIDVWETSANQLGGA